jgi:hypothetical protein
MMDFIESFRRKKNERRKKEVNMIAKEIFQITECDGRLWFTYDHVPYCPCDMMKDDALTALGKLREAYVVRNNSV